MVSLPPETWRKVEDYRFDNRINTESGAIRRLIDAGLAHEGLSIFAGIALGILQAHSAALTEEEQITLQYVWQSVDNDTPLFGAEVVAKTEDDKAVEDALKSVLARKPPVTRP